MALTVRASNDRNGVLPNSRSSNPLLTVEDGVGVIAIDGPIIRKPDIFARVLLGATVSEEIGSAIREAGSRADIRAVFLDIDSPGGTVSGTPELASAVASLSDRKPVYAFTLGPDVLGRILDSQPSKGDLRHSIRPRGINRSRAGRD